MFHRILSILLLVTVSCTSTSSIELLGVYKVCSERQEHIHICGFHEDSICGKERHIFYAHNCTNPKEVIIEYKKYLSLNPISSLCAQDHYVFYGKDEYSHKKFYRNDIKSIGINPEASDNTCDVPMAFEYSYNIQEDSMIYIYMAVGGCDFHWLHVTDSIPLSMFLGNDALKYRDSVCTCGYSTESGVLRECDSSMLYAKPVDRN